jgi:hypothetical protein
MDRVQQALECCGQKVTHQHFLICVKSYVDASTRMARSHNPLGGDEGRIGVPSAGTPAEKVVFDLSYVVFDLYYVDHAAIMYIIPRSRPSFLQEIQK